MSNAIKKGDKVLLRSNSGITAWTGEVTKLGKCGDGKCYVLFDGGGYLLKTADLEKAQ